MSMIRKIMFGFIAVAAIPAFFFLTLELVLKWVGPGKSFDYFNTIEIDGEDYFQDNPYFIEQFYPASLDITPLENTFAAEPDDDVLRIFVLGGSAARGFPNPAHGFSRQLWALLSEALPGRQIEVVNTAMTAINSHVVYAAARSFPQGIADFAIVLMGNNEVIGPYGPGTFNQEFFSNIELIRALQALKRSNFGQTFLNAVGNLTPSDHKQDLEWKGMQMFANETVPYEDPRLETVYAHYRRNLADIVDTLQEKGAHVVLSTVPVNLRHSAPFASSEPEHLTEQQIESFQMLTADAAGRAAQQDWQGAVSHYSEALELTPRHADTLFELALAQEHSGNHDSAASRYVDALDYDSLRFRADSHINGIIRDLASMATTTQLTFVDNDLAFKKSSEPFSPGWDLFYEHVHYNFVGDYLLAREFTRAILGRLGIQSNDLLSQVEVASRVGYPSNMTMKVLDRVLGMVQSPPFIGQSNQDALMDLIKGKINDVEAELGTVPEQIARREGMLRGGGGDWRIYYEMAHLYEHVGNRQAMYQQLYQLYEAYPFHHDSLVMTAKMLHQDKQYRREIPYLQQALLHARGDELVIAQLTGWLGLAYFKIGDDERAVEALQSVPRQYPEQVHYALQAYATLIRHADEAGRAQMVSDYAADAERYAEKAVQWGLPEAYPPFYRKMIQIMRLAGDEAAVRKWQHRSLGSRPH
jgi:tetratricopeptide (TPR) repeat protein